MVIEEKSSLIEGVIGAVAVVVVLASTLSAPRLNSNLSREELTQIDKIYIPADGDTPVGIADPAPACN